ncbi:hypothetical protein MPL3365_170147 [Mesorhizobium plurifarium]|uniref:Uncharacterized protein n=1 Tax=Mesorhizobium plurifarium TaxID=69974 RepID=A0A090G5N5_MESPL|nr:hypothetical protein MPL3365_170147 [Mesorhizobium plurifarium]
MIFSKELHLFKCCSLWELGQTRNHNLFYVAFAVAVICGERRGNGEFVFRRVGHLDPSVY